MLLPLKNLEGSQAAMASTGLSVTWLPQLGLLQSPTIASLCRGATYLLGEEQPLLSLLIVSGKLEVNGSVNLQKELSQAQSEKEE